MSSWFDKWIADLDGNPFWMQLGLQWTIAIFLSEDPSVSLILYTVSAELQASIC